MHREGECRGLGILGGALVEQGVTAGDVGGGCGSECWGGGVWRWGGLGQGCWGTVRQGPGGLLGVMGQGGGRGAPAGSAMARHPVVALPCAAPREQGCERVNPPPARPRSLLCLLGGQGLGRGESLDRSPSWAQPSPAPSGASSELASPSPPHVTALTLGSGRRSHPSPSPAARSGLPLGSVRY